MSTTRRWITASAAVDTFGDGLWLAGGALFFNRAVGLPLVLVGAGLTIAGLVALPVGLQLARLGDGRGPRGTYLTLTLVQATAFTAMVFVHSFLPFVLLAATAAAANQGAQAIRGGIIRTVGGAEAVRFRAGLHAIMNVAIALGAATAGLVIAVNTRFAYDLLVIGDAATFAAAGLTLARIPAIPATTRRPDSRAAIRDRRYVFVAALDGVMDLQYGISGYLLPLWVVTHTSAPRWFASLLLLLNTVIVALLQVRFSAGSEAPEGAARAFRRSGFLFAVAAACFAASAIGMPVLAIVMLVVAMTVHSVGELLHASGAFGLSYGLAPPHAASEYQAVFSLGMGLTRAFAPAVLTFLCLVIGQGGWGVLAVVFVTVGLAAPSATRRALRDRSVETRATASSADPT